MAYQVPTLQQQLGFLVALFKALLPDRNIGSRFTPAWKLMKTIAGAATDVNASVASAQRDVMADTTSGAMLDRQLAIYKPGGLDGRKGATPSRKSKAGRVRGTVAATSNIGDQLIHRASGLMFQINSAVTIPSAGFLDADILAISTGSATQLGAGEVLEYLATPSGLQTQVTLQLALDEDGEDAELDGAARNRLLATLGTPAAGGNQSDYVGWALAQAGIAQAFCYPNRAGIGTVDVAALHSGTGTARYLNAGERAALLADLQALAPSQVAGVGGSLRVLQTIGGDTDTTQLANVEMTVSPLAGPQFQMDWDDATPPTVLSWTAGSLTLQFAAGTRPATMQAGHRICLKGIASVQDSAPLVIQALSGADSVILQSAPVNAPAATDIVYAGGPLTAIIRNAILAHLNGDIVYASSSGPLPAATAAAQLLSTIGLTVIANGLGTANPGAIYGAWVGSLLVSTLAKIAMFTTGVFNQRVLTPAADQDATDYAFPNDATIGILTPGYVLVRKG